MSNINYGSIPSSPPLKTHHLTTAERDLLQSDRPGYGSRTRVEVAFNLVNATVGAGIIGLPFAIAHAGFFTGIFASIIVAVLAQMGLYMLVIAGQRVGSYKYALLVEHLLGRPGYHFLNFMICVQAGGGAVSYFICKCCLPAFMHQFLFLTSHSARRQSALAVPEIPSSVSHFRWSYIYPDICRHRLCKWPFSFDSV